MTRSTRTINNVVHLRCTKCKSWKPAAHFGSQKKRGRAYPRSSCTMCRNKARRVPAKSRKQHVYRRSVEDQMFEARRIAFQERLGNTRARQIVSAPKAAMAGAMVAVNVGEDEV